MVDSEQVFDKLNFMKFATNNKAFINTQISYSNKTTEDIVTTELI
jgi:hypothetical protein